METVTQLDISSAKVARYDTSFSLCIICQEETNEELVENPLAHENVLKCIAERASYGDGIYPQICRRLGHITAKELQSKSATWHRKCYQDTVHAGMCKRAKERYEKHLTTKACRRKSSDSHSSEAGTLTRSQSIPYNKDMCFFCDSKATYQNPLHKVATENAGHSLKNAVEKSGNEKLNVKLSTAIDPHDAHAIDIRYHKRCWAKHVTHVLRTPLGTDATENIADEVAANIEFLSMVEGELSDGNIISMSSLQGAFSNILSANKVKKPECSRKKLKQLLQSEIPELEFHKSKRVNESERVSIKVTRDAAIQQAEEKSSNIASDMKTLYDAASILRKAIDTSEKWKFKGSLLDVSESHIPKELYCFFRWVIQGPSTTLASEEKSFIVDKHVMHLSQSTMHLYLSNRQARNKQSKCVRLTREMPQQLAVGLAIRQAIRSKKIVNLLHGMGMSVEYNRLLRVETQIATSILKHMALNDGVYLPPDIIPGRYVYFAIDNVDFAEDTPDGKHTLHATAMAVYQKCHSGDKPVELEVTNEVKFRSISNMPGTVTELLNCPKPNPHPINPVYPSFVTCTNEQTVSNANISDSVWLLGRSLVRSENTTLPVTATMDKEYSTSVMSKISEANESGEQENFLEEEFDECINIPTWSAYNSLIHPTMCQTRVGTPPLIAAPAHEWHTLLTVLMQAQCINAKVMGPGHKTVISLDMGLYKPAKQLQMSRNDLNHIILRPGELHIVMAQLRCIGAYIENSGIDSCWIEADLYGSATVKQIIDGNHVRRAQEAHVVTLQALFMLYQEAFSQEHPQLLKQIEPLAKDLDQACAEGNLEKIEEIHQQLLQAYRSLQVLEKMKLFDESKINQPLFKVFRHYMEMVLEMMLFIRAVRTGDWKLHLLALEAFTKYFFAHDKLNYARMIPVYLADMQRVKEVEEVIHEQFLDGNWVVNKNPVVPFCAVGADHALEHINRSMKVSGGLVGITLNPCARTKFFLISPEMARLAGEAQLMAGLSPTKAAYHHTMSYSYQKRQELNIGNLTDVLRCFTNPFAQHSEDLFNLMTKAVLPKEVTEDLCRQSEIGNKLFQEFVSERIQSNKTNIWLPMKKQKLNTWKSTGKKIKVTTTGDKVIELQEDRSLFARMMVVCKSRPEINFKEAIGNYEFSVVPRSMFAADGTMLHCSMKSSLMAILEKFGNGNGQETTAEPQLLPTKRRKTRRSSEKPRKWNVALVDAMAEVQSFNKPDGVKTCSHLAHHFTRQIMHKYDKCDEVRFVFDRYDVPQSLKSATRARRLGSQESVFYHITDTTNISRVPMKRLLSHAKTKMELTSYLAEKLLEEAHENQKCFVVAWGCQCVATHKDMSYLNSDQEEADTKLVLHALDATTSGASKLSIHSPDTDVMVLMLRRYPELCEDSSFVTGIGHKQRIIPLNPIYAALGPQKVAALPGFHAISGADNTGCFAGKGKLTCWKAFQDAGDEITNALIKLGEGEFPTSDTTMHIEEFVCQLYLPKTQLCKVKELRWWLFKKKQAQSERLPPTHDALHQAILRAHYQAMVWNNDKVPNPNLPGPENYGWKKEENEWVPVMTTQPPAPDAVLHLVKCGCAKTRCTTRQCHCYSAGLKCTDLCNCSDTGPECENDDQNQLVYDNDENEDSCDDCDESNFNF